MNCWAAARTDVNVVPIKDTNQSFCHTVAWRMFNKRSSKRVLCPRIADSRFTKCCMRCGRTLDSYTEQAHKMISGFDHGCRNGIQKPRFLDFIQKSLKSPNFRFFRLFLENL